MQRTSLALAALATVAVPGMDIYQAQKAPAPDGFKAAYVLDANGKTWVVRAPVGAAAGAALEAEAAFLRTMASFVDSGSLPFVIPKPAGFAPLIQGGRAMVYPHIAGNQLHLAKLRPGPGAAASLGRAIGAIHSLPVHLLEDSAFPSYTTEEYRARRLAELDEGAASGLVPPTLLRRWESALENVALWRFAPVITHTNLSEDSVIMAHGQVSGIIDWSSVQVGDPADDLAWLVAAAPMDSVDSIFEAYQMRRSEALDPHLIDRALLGSELALLRWLLHGLRHDDQDVIEDAQNMLNDLLEATSEVTSTGSFTISTLPAPIDRAPVERIIGETGAVEHMNSSASASSAETSATDIGAPQSGEVGDAPTSSGTDSPDEGPRSDAAKALGDDSPTGTSQSDPSDLGSAGTGADELRPESNSVPAFEFDDLESGEFEIPDYAHARPPQPYADVATELLKTVPDPEESVGDSKESTKHGPSEDSPDNRE